MRRFCVCCAAGCLFFVTASFVSVSHAQILLEENWDSGTIDSGVWTLSAEGGQNNAYVVLDAVNGDPLATGDKALMFNGSNTWAETIESVTAFNRDNNGDGLVIEFTIWVEGGVGAPAQGLNGPFHSPSGTIGPASIELGTTWNWQSHQWSEDGRWNGFDRSNPAPLHQNWPLYHSGFDTIDPTTWQSRFGHSHGKDIDPLRVRYTLGATQGGMIEWYDEINQQWVSEGDFRDGNLGPEVVIQEADPDEDPPVPELTWQQGTSDSTTVRLAWFSFGGGNGNNTPDDVETGILRNGVFIDDIVVYTGTPPTPRGACELPNLTCVDLSEVDCTIRGGNYAGDGTSCTTGACDFDDGSCLVLTSGSCFAQGGLYAGDGTSCTTGACELPDQSCAILTPTACANQSGTYLGDDTTCPMGIPTLAGDCNTDGDLDLSDAVCLLGFLFQNDPLTLPCSTTAANTALMDCNNDGDIDLSDAVYKLTFLFQGGPPPMQGEGCISIEDCPANPGCP